MLIKNGDSNESPFFYTCCHFTFFEIWLSFQDKILVFFVFLKSFLILERKTNRKAYGITRRKAQETVEYEPK